MKTFDLLLRLALVAAAGLRVIHQAAMPQGVPVSSMLGRRAQPGAALAGALFALEGAARTLSGCAAQSTPGFGTVNASQKISKLEGGGPAALDANDRFGKSAAGVGDVDGDGVNDICVGAPLDDDGGRDRGAVYMLLLNTNGTVKKAQKISQTAGGLAASGVALDDGDVFGAAIVGLGDMDGDSVPDIGVSARGDDDGGFNRGALYVLFLNSDGSVKAQPAQKISSTQGGLSQSGVTLGDNDLWPNNLAVAGDVNGDSVTDICFGDPLDDDCATDPLDPSPPQDCGAVTVLFLNSDATVNASQKISFTEGGLGGITRNEDYFGTSIASVGDVDGDSAADICVSAIGDDDGGTDRGALYVLFLNTDGTVKKTQKISQAAGGLAVALGNGDEFGISVAGLGDVDGDNVPDICVGAERDDDGTSGTSRDRGSVYVLFLNTDGTVSASQKISQLAGGLAESGVSLDNLDFFGNPVAAVGDVNGSALTGICVGAFGDDDANVTEVGAVYMLFLNRYSATTAATSATTATTGGPIIATTGTLTSTGALSSTGATTASLAPTGSPTGASSTSTTVSGAGTPPPPAPAVSESATSSANAALLIPVITILHNQLVW